MDETTNAIPGYAHTHGVYGYGNDGRYGRDEDGILVDLINKNDLNNSIREVGRAVDIAATASNAGIAGLSKLASDGIVSTAGLITDLGRDINAGVHNTLVQNLNAFNSVERGIAAAAVATNTQGAAILASIAHCCCEIKEKISTDGQATRALITDNRMHELEDKLAQSRLQASQEAQTNALINALRRNGGGNGGGND